MVVWKIREDSNGGIKQQKEEKWLYKTGKENKNTSKNCNILEMSKVYKYI